MNVVDEMIDYRVRNNLSMADAAKNARITTQTWMYIERGLQNPSRLTEAKIMAVVEEDKNKKGE